MDIKERIDGLTEAEAKAALMAIIDTLIAMQKGFDWALNNAIKEARK